jgi:phosphomevalonate kinase
VTARIARAPGKVVLSGAYSVLEGAPAIVAAVDRYVTADAARPAELVTGEVRAALDAGLLDRAPWFDASPLRAPAPTAAEPGATRKLGLGSSAAILVASLGAGLRDAPSSDAELQAVVLEHALAAHRLAQGGGSGVDVAASVLGGVLACRIRGDAPPDRPLGLHGALVTEAHALPAGTVVRVFASRAAASTSSMLERVRAFALDAPGAYASLMARACAGAEAAVRAADVPSLVAALAAQAEALGELGLAAAAPIATPDVVSLRAPASAEGAALYPAGAGGGDVALFVGPREPSARFVDEAAARGLTPLGIATGARGLHRLAG